jgi:hypothetical protein
MTTMSSHSPHASRPSTFRAPGWRAPMLLSSRCRWRNTTSRKLVPFSHRSASRIFIRQPGCIPSPVVTQDGDHQFDGGEKRVGLVSSGNSWLRLRGSRPSRLLRLGSWRRPWRRWHGRGADIVLRSGDPSPVLPSEARSDFTEGGVDAEGAAAPPPSTSEPAGSVSMHMFFAAVEAQTYCRRVVKLCFFSSCFEYQGLLVGSRIVYPS